MENTASTGEERATSCPFAAPEVPPTKAAATRARKARKGSDGKTDDAKTVNLNAEEKERGRKYDEEVARQSYLLSLSQDASFIAAAMQDYAAAMKTADEAAEAQEQCFTVKMKDPAFADKIDHLRDWSATKKKNEFITINGKEYSSIKKLFKEELHISYEYVRRICKKLPRLGFLLEDDPQQGVPPPPPAPTDQTSPPPPAPPRRETQPRFEVLSVNGKDPSSRTVEERVASAVSYATECAENLSAAEKYEFYTVLLRRVQEALDEAEEAHESQEKV
jgi:hypothetical protein